MKHVKIYEESFKDIKVDDFRIAENYLKYKFGLITNDNFKKVLITQPYNDSLLLRFFFYSINSEDVELFKNINTFLKKPNPEYWELEGDADGCIVLIIDLNFEDFENIIDQVQLEKDMKKYNL